MAAAKKRLTRAPDPGSRRRVNRNMLTPRITGVGPNLDLTIPGAVAQTVPVLARYAVTAGRRAAGWGFTTSLHASVRVLRAAVAGESPSDLFREFEDELRDYGRRLLGVADAERRLWRIVAPEAAALDASQSLGVGKTETAAALRIRGKQLLRRSADIAFDEATHPAYARILAELAPDEARILRLLHREGPQPSVDVRTSKPLNVASQMVEPGLSMIGALAGCKYLDRVPSYLNNLYRLGLIWFSREPVPDANRYQVLEVQPDVMEAKRRAGRARTVRRSILMTPFGTDFCDMCLPGS